MYEKESINKLARECVKTKCDKTFETLIKELIPIIDIQLRKRYPQKEEFWDDMRQDALLGLWKNRWGAKSNLAKNPYINNIKHKAVIRYDDKEFTAHKTNNKSNNKKINNKKIKISLD